MRTIKTTKFYPLVISILLITLSFDTQANPKNEKLNPYKGSLELSSGNIIDIRVAYSEEDKVQGLSGVKINQFSKNNGLLFYYPKNGPRRFWMIDTYFNLDIIFLNENLEVVSVEKNVLAHPGRSTPPTIAQTPTIICRHVLEIRADSPLSLEIKKGTKFKWKEYPSFLQTK